MTDPLTCILFGEAHGWFDAQDVAMEATFAHQHAKVWQEGSNRDSSHDVCLQDLLGHSSVYSFSF